MDPNSRMTQDLLAAFSKGYRVDQNGSVLSPLGRQVKASCPPRGNGYWKFGVVVEKGRRASIFVHRLVAYQKFGEAVLNPQVQTRHLDGNTSNNSWDNIAIGTKSDNEMDKPKRTRRRAALIATRSVRRLSDFEVLSIYRDHDAGLSYNALKAKYGVGKSTLSFLFNRAQYTQRVLRSAEEP